MMIMSLEVVKCNGRYLHKLVTINQEKTSWENSHAGYNRFTDILGTFEGAIRKTSSIISSYKIVLLLMLLIAPLQCFNYAHLVWPLSEVKFFFFNYTFSWTVKKIKKYVIPSSSCFCIRLSGFVVIIYYSSQKKT